MNGLKYRRLVAEKEIANGIVDVKKKTLKNYYELHWHDFFEITYYFEGRGQNIINGKKYDICPGSAVFLTPTDYHEILVDEPMTEVTLMINPDVIDDELVFNTVSLDEAVFCVFRGEEREKLEFLLEMLQNEFRWNKQYGLSCQKNLVGLIVAQVVRGFGSARGTEDSAERSLAGKNEKLFKKAMSYILMNFTNNPGLAEISEHLGYSPCYFSRHFHELAGVSYKEYIRKLRLNHAKRLLVSGDMSVAEVATNSGYATLQVFLADFKKVYGETPTAFRKRYLGKG
ncbi:MAG: helix-turn-helix domain-containing protein [Ruminococcaceae bacterium]|nr:helix-turn-helix domain-containing protein [Oscillospiraceae bacterium]